MEFDPVSSSPLVGHGTPSDTPHQTSLFSTSRRSSGRGTPSSFTPSTPPALPTENHVEKDVDQTDDVPPLDPRRLTPNLHANLVSEILTLRREVESKDTLIDKLEGELATSKSENDSLQENIAKRSKETSAVKLQLQSIETGTLTALEDLCKERDEAKEAAAELKKRLDGSQRQVRVETEKNSRLHKDWETEKVKWMQETNLLKRKHDLTESRLKAVLDELVVYESQAALNGTSQDVISEQQDVFSSGNVAASSHSSPVKARTHRRNRSSISTIGSGRPDSVPFGINLADELDIHEDEAPSEVDASEDPSSRLSKDLGMNDIHGRDWAQKNIPSPEKRGHEHMHLQSSPFEGQSSPSKLDRQSLIDHATLVENSGNSPEQIVDNVPRASLVPKNILETIDAQTSNPDAHANNNLGNQTQEFENTQASSTYGEGTISQGARSAPNVEMFSASTQTDVTFDRDSTAPSALLNAAAVPLPIPEIAIHAPQSRPSSLSDAVLPPGTKSVANQTDTTLLMNSQSIGVQTDIIRVDSRALARVAHLLPSSSMSHSQLETMDQASDKTQSSGTDNSARTIIPAGAETEKKVGSHPTDRSTQPTLAGAEVEDPTWTRLRRNLAFGSKQVRPSDQDPFKFSEEAVSAEVDHAASTPATRPMRRQQKLGKPFDPPTPVPEDEKVVLANPNHNRAQASSSGRNSLDRSSTGVKPPPLSISSKGKHIRQNSERSGTPTSIASSSAWSKSTGIPSGIVVPQRTSSIGARQRRADGNSSPPFRSGGSSPTKGRDGKRVGKKLVLRKTRSASLAPSEYRSDGQRSFPVSPYSQTSFASGEISPPPVPENAILNVYRGNAHQRSSSSQTRRLSAVYPTGNASVGSSIQHSVVDAIAATMVGEWMWKYVRKRKTFGTSESAQEAARTSDQRHKRWVWLSPYERTLMWSSKQPTTNTALMGRAGRTVTIQSVLDVKDESHSAQSKTSENVFNRSILVLTPSRAIKFTASSRERHYLWLTALSFLAHHTAQGSLDLSFLPPNGVPGSPIEETEPDLSRTTSATASRNGRKPWSSRTTNRSQQSSGYGTPSIPEATASAEGEAITLPPKPSRPAPGAPSTGAQENIPSESAMAPTVPRIPGGAFPVDSKNIFGIPKKHNRNRSASITGVMSVNRQPVARSKKAGTSSTRSYPNTGATNSSNHSTKSGINLPNARRGNTIPTPPVINVTSMNGGAVTPLSATASIAKYLGSSSSNPAQSQVASSVDQNITVESHGAFSNGGTNSAVEQNFAGNMSNGSRDIMGTDFGGNSRFFDAVGTSLGGAPALEPNSIPAPAAPPPPRRAAPPPPSSTAPTGGHRHVSGDSFDSVAPPPIRGARPFAQKYDSDFPYDASYSQYEPDDSNRMTATQTGNQAKEVAAKPARPPSRKRGFFGLGGRS